MFDSDSLIERAWCDPRTRTRRLRLDDILKAYRAVDLLLKRTGDQVVVIEPDRCALFFTHLIWIRQTEGQSTMVIKVGLRLQAAHHRVGKCRLPRVFHRMFVRNMRTISAHKEQVLR